MDKREAEMIDFAMAELKAAADDMVREEKMVREACTPVVRACNSLYAGRLLARLLSNLGVTQKPCE